MNKIGKSFFLFGVIIIFIIITAIFYREQILRIFYKPTQTSLQEGVRVSEDNTFEIVAENLQIPWEIVFLSDGDMLVTERQGTLKRVGKTGIVYNIEGVKHIGEGGLLGMALHPNFENNKLIYFYLTTAAGNSLKNRVERYRFENDRLYDKKIIIDNIPGATYHDGGRIAFGPDGYLYISTGDASQSNLAQDINSLAGKILRLKDDGSVPADNPFGNAVYSYGHRNPQGLAWDNTGRIWATEHGRSGILSGLDELNLIEKGKNYGWPVTQGDEKREGMESPIIQSGPNETWAPAGAAYLDGSILFTGLRGESIYQVKILENGNVGSITTHFRGTFGRLRAIKIGPDGFFYVSTSNTDGRGEPRPGDDKIIKIDPKVFHQIRP